MINKLATVCGGKSLFDFPQEPLVLVHHALDSLNHEGFTRTALLGRQAAKLLLQVRIKGHIHTLG
jgi:hypothetical protein